MDISIALKKLRKTTVFSQSDFADKLGISQTYLSLLENGKKTPSLDVIKQYEQLTKIPLSVILLIGMEEKDVPKSRAKLYAQLKPVIDSLINQLFTELNNK